MAFDALRSNNQARPQRQVNLAAVTSRLSGLEGVSANFGWIDYTDGSAGSSTALTAGVDNQVTRSLSASSANNKLLGPFEGHDFWDDTNKLITPRALNDIVAMSFYVKINPGSVGGSIRLALRANTLEIAAKPQPITTAAGTADELRIDFQLSVRGIWLANGAKIMLRPSVAADLIEISPEFQPMGYAP